MNRTYQHIERSAMRTERAWNTRRKERAAFQLPGSEKGPDQNKDRWKHR